jgi:hypothetical protein
MLEALIATGYLRTARDVTNQETSIKPQYFFQRSATELRDRHFSIASLQVGQK